MNVPLPALLLLAMAALLLAGCGDDTAQASHTSPPLADIDNAYDAAARIELEKVAPNDHEDLHNVYRLSETIMSGGEPLTPEALGRIAKAGVKTILSVDGKVPDAEEAQKHGMRYVHVPIRYSGITDEQLLKIAKTFRELEPPFYAHCFHGKHRGPAAAAVGRLVLDGATREQALAEMRQWSGTSKKYEALYRAIAVLPMPTPEETAAYEFGFESAHGIGGVRAGMVQLTRTFDNVKLLHANGWKPDDAHPDIDAVNEVETLHGYFEALATHDDSICRPDDYQAWMKSTVSETGALLQSLRAVQRGEDAGADAEQHFVLVKDLCAACHAPYRNR